ncbi:helix-turn-helix domain-containing protein [Sediminibacillus dalangtanensis]|uniref:Helix-turn-helix domain-containing protein n=1 Tax=Sediminibacillus dalangtanensis TaxID=2729421 RepID=A0ABX7VNG2_9BACI|nr:AraC family transcriptional regulator [Sediminibacillus dalangtanensis]QTM97943.1 helix-turn-helix domain-containing protein [Sediminibacillus dalangtanensis]
MAWVESIQRAIDYMEAHLLEPISLQDVAKQAHVSTFHFQRTFTILTDISVGEYIRRRRLTLAAQELMQTSIKVIDLAYKYGYDTPEAFAKAFRRQHGISPSESRKLSGMLTFYNRLTIQVQLKGADPMKYRIVEMEDFQVAGMKRSFSLTNDENIKEIPKWWDQVNNDGTDDQLFRLNNGPIKGVLGVCVDHKNDKQTIDYWVATAFNGDPPQELEQMNIPASRWAVFEARGPVPDAIQKLWKRIFTEWFPTSGYSHAGTPELEVYSSEDPASPDIYSEVWIPVK